MRRSIPLMGAALILAFMSVSVFAVHKDAGDLVCVGCHTMHNSQNDASMGGSPTDYLLRGTGVSDLCLSCHDNAGTQYSTYSSTVPVVKDGAGSLSGMGAGGDFAHLDATNDAAAIDNQGNGHNETGTNVTPAGGGSQIASFHCGTCHDPHGIVDSTDADDGTGTVDSYRNLLKDPDGDATNVEITNATEGTTLTNSVYPISGNVYGVAGTSGSGMSAWCAQCHPNFHGTTNTGDPAPWIRHPTDEDMTADNTGETDWSHYDGNTEATYVKLPLQDAAASATANTSEQGNESADQVFCLSCHFAHAGGDGGSNDYADALRWDHSGALSSYQGCEQCHNK
jgi:predicted CXXCH cytochrome family protein